MTKEQRLEKEVELFRTYRNWYNPAYASEEELTNAIKDQEGIVELFSAKAEGDPTEENIDTVIEEVMKLEIWKDILANRTSVIEGSQHFMDEELDSKE